MLEDSGLIYHLVLSPILNRRLYISYHELSAGVYDNMVAAMLHQSHRGASMLHYLLHPQIATPHTN